MKNIFFFFLILFGFQISAQDGYKSGIQNFQTPREGKALVYILRSGAGALLNFGAYMDDKFLGTIAGDDYLVVECEPGYHLFWATSENRDYMEGHLQPNRVYVLNIKGEMGYLIASVSFKQFNPSIKSDKNYFYRSLKNGNAIVYNSNNIIEDKKDNIDNGLEKYKELKAENSKKIITISTSLAFKDGNKFIQIKN